MVRSPVAPKITSVAGWTGRCSRPSTRGFCCSCMLGLLCERLLGAFDHARGVDDPEMAEGLGEITHLPPAHDVVLLREQAEVIREAEQALVERACLRDPPGQGQGAREPERTGEELALVAGQAVVGMGGRVPRQQAVTRQLP